MTFALKFRDHQQFQRSVLLTVAAGATSGALFWASIKSGLGHWPATAISAGLLSMAIGAGSATNVDAQRRKWNIAFRALLLFIGLTSLATQTGATALIGFGVAAAAAFAIDQQRWRGLVAASVGGLGAVVASEVALRVLVSAQFESAPTIVTMAVAGAGFGLSLAAPMAVRHLDLIGDRVARRYQAVWAQTSGEVQELVGRGYGVWNQARDLPEGDENRALLEEAIMRLFDTAEQWSATNKSSESASEAGLRDRMLSLKERIDSTSDSQTRGEYEQAHAALAEQLKYLDGIRTNRERVVARLHNYLAAMERLRLALVTAQSSRKAADLAPMTSTLEEIGRDLDNELNGDA